MEPLGNLNSNTNNNFIKTNNTQTGGGEIEAPTQTQRGLCEHDAIHPRLLKKHQNEVAKCLSCEQVIESTSLHEIFEHYANVAHNNCIGKCYYCGGKVHQYQYFKDIHTYHSCTRSIGHIDK